MSDVENILLDVQNLQVSYGAIRALRGISLQVKEGEIVCVIGANGAGKSTLMNALMSEVRREKGLINFSGAPLAQRSYDVVKQGISLVPEGRRVFAPLTVYENLMMGAFPRKEPEKVKQDLQWVFSLFPRLEERRDQYAGTLSGGEQQMLAIGRALMGHPKLLMLDEPSMGLAPLIIEEVFERIVEINRLGTPVLLVEQNATLALKVSQRAYILERGRIKFSGPSQEEANDERVREAYLGVTRR